MEKEFVLYPEALELKELGFDEPCFGYYKHTTVPNKIISNDLIVGFIKDSRIYNDVSNGSSLVGLGKGLVFAPTFSQVFRWFREKYNLKSCIMFRTSMEDNKEYYDWLIKGQEVVYRHFNTYEEAELACLKKLIELVKEMSK